MTDLEEKTVAGLEQALLQQCANSARLAAEKESLRNENEWLRAAIRLLDETLDTDDIDADPETAAYRCRWCSRVWDKRDGELHPDRIYCDRADCPVASSRTEETVAQCFALTAKTNSGEKTITQSQYNLLATLFLAAEGYSRCITTLVESGSRIVDERCSVTGEPTTMGLTHDVLWGVVNGGGGQPEALDDLLSDLGVVVEKAP